jgi:hypothetical protein
MIISPGTDAIRARTSSWKADLRENSPKGKVEITGGNYTGNAPRQTRDPQRGIAGLSSVSHPYFGRKPARRNPLCFATHSPRAGGDAPRNPIRRKCRNCRELRAVRHNRRLAIADHLSSFCRKLAHPPAPAPARQTGVAPQHASSPPGEVHPTASTIAPNCPVLQP